MPEPPTPQAEQQQATEALAVSPDTGAETDNQASSQTGSEPEPTISITLETTVGAGGFAFRGVGGDIDGVLNPEIAVNPGDVVEIILVNGDGIQHDLTAPALDVHTEHVQNKESQTRTVFEVTEEGTFEYYCSVPGHREAGMEGLFVIGSGQSQAGQAEASGEGESSAGTAEENTGYTTPSGESTAGNVDVAAAPAAQDATSIVLDPTNLPPPLEDRAPATLEYTLETVELNGVLADGTTFTYWTFNGTVPGPFLRIRQGDTVEITLINNMSSTMAHSIDLHAVTGPGGGATVTQAAPGEEKSFTFQAINPGLYVYHCATPMVAHHIANGMYGLILVEPEGGLPEVDHEFYVMQGEIYTAGDFGDEGHQQIDIEALLDEDPEYVVFNGAVGAITEQFPMHANTGETVRIFFGVGGPNFTSSFHVIGEIFDRVYDQASLTANPLTDVQTTLVPAGGATMVEFSLEVPGRYLLVDHALARLERGLVGFLVVDGEPNPEVFFSDEEASTEGH
jgi:nitrite reductase (NO-forming)